MVDVEHIISWGLIVIGATDYDFSTLQIIQEFGIPIGHHLLIEDIIVSNTQANANFDLRWDRPFVAKEIQPLQSVLINTIRFRSGTGKASFQLSDLGIHVYDTLFMSISSGGADVSIGYRFHEGEMRFQDDMAEQIAEFRKVGQPQTSAGGEFHRVGDIKIIGIGENI